MIGIVQRFIARVTLPVLLILMGGSALADDTRFQPPFDSVNTVNESEPLVLGEVLSLVAKVNPTLKALNWQNEAARGRLRQAGLWSNPELDAEIEEAGWDAPGLRESEISISVAQEFDFFGRRNARKQVARAEIDATELRTKLSAYDLYLETKRRFYALVHAQESLVLSTTSVELAQDIVENIEFRIGKGVALQSELLLAMLQEQRAQLMLEESRQDVASAQVAIAALWKGNPSEVVVITQSEPELFDLLRKVMSIETEADSTRGVLELDRQKAILRAEQSLAVAEVRPSITLSSGYKRLEVNNSNSLLFGISLPLPFLDRNQGTRESLKAELRSLDYETDRIRLEIGASIRSRAIKLRQLAQRHETLDTLLLPTAEEAYRTLQSAYKAGPISYTQLLEAERSLNELRFEHNDMLLEIQQQVIALEALTGITLRIDEEQ